jgi:hypothetical protein
MKRHPRRILGRACARLELPRQTHRARRLFKATRTEHARAPSIGSIRTLRSSRRSCARCSLALTSPRTLSLAPSPACPVKGWQLASSYPAALGSSRVTPRLTASARKMRLSDFCNRLTTRAPTVLPDSRSRSLRASQPCDHATLRSRYQVKLRLTANLQLRPCHNPRGASWAGARSSPPSDTARYWYESLDRKLSRAVPPVRRLVSRARACRPTSDVLCRDCPAQPCLSAELALAAVGLLLHRCLVKSSCFVETRASSLDECPLLRASLPAPACATAGNQTRIHREPATVPTLGGPASDIVFTPRTSRGRAPRGPNGYPGHCQRQHTEACCQRHAPSACLPSTSAIKQPTSTTSNHPNPGRDCRRDASSSRWTWRKPSGRGWGPVRLVDRRFRVTSPLPPAPRPCGLDEDFCVTPAELLRARGLSDERPTFLPR